MAIAMYFSLHNFKAFLPLLNLYKVKENQIKSDNG